MKKLLHNLESEFKNKTLKSKFMLIIVFVMMLISLFFLLGFRIYCEVQNKLLYKTIAGNMSFSAYTLSSNLKDLERLSDLAISNASIQKKLTRIYETDDTAVISQFTNDISEEIQNYYNTYSKNGIYYISLLNKQFASSTNYVYYKWENEELLADALDQANKADGGIVWVLNNEETHRIMLARQIRKINKLELTPIGILLISVDIDKLMRTVNHSFQTFENGSYIICDGTTPVYVSLSDDLSDDLSDELLSRVFESMDNDYEIMKHGKNTYFVVNYRIPGYNWSYINLVPYDDIRSSDLTVILAALIIVFGLGAAIYLSRLLINSVIIHFNSLLDKMNQLSENEYSFEKYQYDYSNRKDEIGHLHQKFDWMAGRINYLVNVNLKNELLTREAQLKALEAQINPHFLYNSLESINWRAKAHNNNEISQIAESLGILLRETLRNKDSLVSLNYELQLVDSYITIQKIRYEDRLIYVLDTDGNIGDDIKIPPLTIQPLLENAIRYGVEEIMEPCRIYLTLRRLADVIEICVMNEGSVFEKDLLNKLRQNNKKATGFGIGLLNIDQRLKLLFGNDFGLHLENREDYATAVINIPLPMERSDHD